ncbi:MAG: hypothetical protein NZ949_05420, partial [Candidatus Kapabacteria bacterium]|nr:hypothetical protein [Candidatus Kapabacteria bacterium]MDW7996349.1 hypothetical protein [Bacteroidota bacterium]
IPERAGAATVELYTPIGQQLWQWHGIAGANPLQISLAGLPAGLYSVIVTVDGQRTAIPVVVTN